MTRNVFAITTLALATTLCAGSAGVLANDAATPAAAVLSNPRDAGIRYGQAAGMAAVCENIKPTAKAESLAGTFTGQDLETFKIQAETVLKSWKKTLTCAHVSDPNPCRLAHQMSCREALKEIGPNGTVAAGLVEISKAN